MPPTPASTITRYKAACTRFLVVTTRRAESPMTADSSPKKMFSATTGPPDRARDRDATRYSACHRDLVQQWSLLGTLLGLGPRFQCGRLGHRLHPLAQTFLV